MKTMNQEEFYFSINKKVKWLVICLWLTFSISIVYSSLAIPQIMAIDEKTDIVVNKLNDWTYAEK